MKKQYSIALTLTLMVALIISTVANAKVWTD